MNGDFKNMELLLNDAKAKELLTEIMIELMQSKREFFHEIVLEALEEVSLANAIIEGRKNDFVEEDKIFALLDGN
jgi:hypothetical protein